MIKHKFFTRDGGVSEGGFSSLNLSESCGDKIAHVMDNKDIIKEEFDGKFLAMVNQVHGNECIVVDGEYGELPDADAMVTNKKNIVLGVVTADCAPVLFYGKDRDDNDVIGAAHAGWRGAVDGVCQVTIDKILLLGCYKRSIKAIIGPCIGKESYEVDRNFYNQFNGCDEFFYDSRNDGHFMFDLSKYIESELLNYGIGSVSIDGRDTYLLEDKFFSYRRATHKREKECGRQVSTIMISNW